MGKRREPRKPVEEQVRISAPTLRGKYFSETVSTADVSQNGAKLCGVRARLNLDEIIGVSYGKNNDSAWKHCHFKQSDVVRGIDVAKDIDRGIAALEGYSQTGQGTAALVPDREGRSPPSALLRPEKTLSLTVAPVICRCRSTFVPLFTKNRMKRNQ
jgi:hypothetical protein